MLFWRSSNCFPPVWRTCWRLCRFPLLGPGIFFVSELEIESSDGSDPEKGRELNSNQTERTIWHIQSRSIEFDRKSNCIRGGIFKVNLWIVRPRSATSKSWNYHELTSPSHPPIWRQRTHCRSLSRSGDRTRLVSPCYSLFIIHYALFELVIKQRTNKAKLVQCWQKLLANAQNEEEAEEAEEQSVALCEKSASNFQFGHGKTAKLTLSLAISLYPYLYLMMEMLNPQWWISNLVSWFLSAICTSKLENYIARR